MRNLFCAAILGSLLFWASCERLGESRNYGVGKLCLSFADAGSKLAKSDVEIPDTSDFILTIRSSDGSVLYDGLWGDCPEALEVEAGAYTVTALSGLFDKPAFSSPQYGDEQCVVVPAGGRADVNLVCTQMNAGVHLDISDDFLLQCPDAVLFLKSSAGRLMYSYSEKRIAYFSPGTVSLIMNESGKDNVIMVMELKAREMLSVKVSVVRRSESMQAGISMSVDTTRIWRSDSCVIGDVEDVGSDDVMTVAQARNSSGKEDVWVSGYIVGGDLSSASASFKAPFKSNTNLLLGPKSSTTDRDACIAVQLPAGEVRDALNLVDNPENLKRKVCVRGDLVSAYFAMPGIKNTNAFKLL